MVPAPAPGALIRGSEQSFHLGISQEPDQPPRLALIGNDEDLLDSGRLSWLLERDIAEERTNGGETKVAGASHIVAVSLTVIEKGPDQRCIEVLPGELRRYSVLLSMNKLEQQTKGVAIASDGMGAHIPLVHESFGEEPLE